MNTEVELKPKGPDPDDSEVVVLLGVGTEESNAHHKNQDFVNSAIPDFIDELEDVLSNTDKLFIRESQPAIPDVFLNFNVTSVYEVLNGYGERGFLFGRRRENGSILSFVIVTNSGHGILTFKQYGFFSQHFEIEGAGILKFNQVRGYFGGYVLQDKWKKLLLIRPSWIQWCTFCLSLSNTTATMQFVNLDGTPSGTLSYKKWISLGFEDRTLCVHFIPQLDRKAKYMIFAACLVPFSSYFTEPSRSNNSILQILLYILLFVFIIVGVPGVFILLGVV